MTFKKLKSANLGDEVYVVVKTSNLANKKVWLNVKQGKVEKLKLETEEKGLMLQHDKGANTQAEAVVGAYTKDDKITNKTDFKDWAIFKITLGGKDTKEEKEELGKLKDKKAFMYLLVDAHTPNDIKVVYNGRNPDKNGELDKRTTPNQWLDIDSKWFELFCRNGVLDEMKKLVDRHIKYGQTGVRNSLSEEGLKNLDCSETVAIYLYKLGVMPKLKTLYTGIMTSEDNFRKAVGSNKIKHVEKSKENNFKPQRGDIFVWRKSNGVGHTGIVYKYDKEKDLVTILEAIGKVGSADEKTNKKNGGHTGTGCSRTAVYKRTGKALSSHSGWKGYFRPINYTKTL
ncbi:CHAP domain-containing protein [Tenacibaculum gallaicum]|uniref:CHAP domain-containing protein n=1 Tax=Tenacibaculum gallaicum TaxID=561505 RepID=A0A3E0HJ75_9FLAO|nr:CHAP domain-containing protein [Tenacibaculum gallaicum]REH46513.1 CHAP domain-containing protein [Tenacibaculum gallaicum]